MNRRGILDGNVLGVPHCKCLKHNKVWKEGDDFEDCGGKACRECVEASIKKHHNKDESTS